MSHSVGIIEVPRPEAVGRARPYVRFGVCARHMEQHCLTFLHWARHAAGSQQAPNAVCPLCCREVVTAAVTRTPVSYYGSLLRERVDAASLEEFIAAFSPESEGLDGDAKLSYAVLLAATLLNQDHRKVVGDLLIYKAVRI